MIPGRYNYLIGSLFCLVVTFSPPCMCKDNGDEKLSAAANCFNLNLYKELTKSRGSFVSSPFSLYDLLSILHTGAGGKTDQQLIKGLGYENISVSEMEDSFKSKLSKLKSSNGNTLEVANSIWIQNEFEVKQSFKDTVVKKFDSKVDNVDFNGNPHEATTQINSWGSEKTHGLIPSLFDQDLDPQTIMVLVNAIYFKGQWASKFDKTDTKDGDFYNNDSKNNPSKVKLMHQQNTFKYTLDKTLKAQVLQMDYNGTDTSMFIILPQAGSNIEALERALNCQNINTAMNSWSETLVDVTLPKFEITSSFDLKQPITDLEMGNIFEESADFSGIAPRIAVSQAIQKAIIKVYEEGSEAAALTGIGMVALSAIEDPEPQVVYFKADHPFIFMIRNNPTNLILFTGKVTDLPNA